MDQVKEIDWGAFGGAESILPLPVHVIPLRVHLGRAPELSLRHPAELPFCTRSVLGAGKGERENARLPRSRT